MASVLHKESGYKLKYKKVEGHPCQPPDQNQIRTSSWYINRDPGSAHTKFYSHD